MLDGAIERVVVMRASRRDHPVQNERAFRLDRAAIGRANADLGHGLRHVQTVAQRAEKRAFCLSFRELSAFAPRNASILRPAASCGEPRARLTASSGSLIGASRVEQSFCTRKRTAAGKTVVDAVDADGGATVAERETRAVARLGAAIYVCGFTARCQAIV